jgi:transcriptional regulator with XRE-family HTH domain
MELRAVAESLGVSPRTVFDWEKRYDHPSTPNLITWAYGFGLCLVLVESRTNQALVPVPLEAGQPLVRHELGRIAGRLKQAREALGITQEDLALMVVVTRSSLQRWEDNDQTPGALHLITWADRLKYRVVLIPERP